MRIDDDLLNCSSSKLIEYYSFFKSICEGYSISISEYTQIFGCNQLSFAVWDIKGRGMVDAIEMFAGLVVFSKIKYDYKVKFFFEIFDLNEEGSLTYEGLIFMLVNICNATYKVYQMNRTIPMRDVQLFLNEYYF